MPIHAPKIGVWGQFDPLNGQSINATPPNTHPCIETRRMTYRLSKSVHCFDLCAWLSNQKKKQRQISQTVANWVFAQTTHVVRSIYSFAWWLVFGWYFLVSCLIKIGSAVTEMWGVKTGLSLIQPSITVQAWCSHLWFALKLWQLKPTGLILPSIHVHVVQLVIY